MLVTLAWTALALAALYAALTLINLLAFRTPPRPRPYERLPALSVLIPARDEERNIGPALEAVLLNRDVDLEVVVLDDGSSDRTAAIVGEIAARDGRVRLERGAGLPAGWSGKQHACWRLSHLARHDLMVFVDADVRLAPGALGRVAHFMERRRLDLASGFPRQIAVTYGEQLTVPAILMLLLGYLPFPFARLFSRAPGFAAGCGQLMAVRREAYRRAGGHEAIRRSMHDGIMLPRAVRRAGGRTEVFDGTALATCRMYESWPEVWDGFSKNATEGMAKPVALPVWTLLLGGGHVLPFLLLPLAILLGDGRALELALTAALLVLGARTALALRVGQRATSVLLHPLAVVVTLWIQWSALIGRRRGRPATWRGRTYDV